MFATSAFPLIATSHTSHLDQKLTQAPARCVRLRRRSERHGPSRSHAGGAQLITTLKSEYDLNAHRLFGPDETCDTTLARFGSNSFVILKPRRPPLGIVARFSAARRRLHLCRSHTYELPSFPVLHADLYRVSDPSDLDEIGLSPLPEATVALIEWPERAASALPADRIDIALSHRPVFGNAARTTE